MVSSRDPDQPTNQHILVRALVVKTESATWIAPHEHLLVYIDWVIHTENITCGIYYICIFDTLIESFEFLRILKRGNTYNLDERH